MSEREGLRGDLEGFQRRQAEASTGVQVEKDIRVRDAGQPVNSDFEAWDNVCRDFGIGDVRR